jgi:hypothetical protein
MAFDFYFFAYFSVCLCREQKEMEILPLVIFAVLCHHHTTTCIARCCCYGCCCWLLLDVVKSERNERFVADVYNIIYIYISDRWVEVFKIQSSDIFICFLCLLVAHTLKSRKWEFSFYFSIHKTYTQAHKQTQIEQNEKHFSTKKE